MLFYSLAERPEEPVDNRTLYERLKAQKDQKQEEYEEQFKFSTCKRVFDVVSINMTVDVHFMARSMF